MFRFFRIYFGVYSSKQKSERQHCRVSACARSQLMVFFFFVCLSSFLHFFFDIGSFQRICRFSYIFFGAGFFFPACDFQFNRRTSLWWRWLWCGQVTQRPTYLQTVECIILYMKESRSKGFICWTPHFGARQCNSKRDSIEWSLTQNWKNVRGRHICVSTSDRERRLVWSYSRCHGPCKLEI